MPDPNDPDQFSGYDDSQKAEIEEAEGDHVTDGTLITDLARERDDADAAVLPPAAEEQLDGIAGVAPNKPGVDEEEPADTPATRDTQSTVTPDDYPDDADGKPDHGRGNPG